MKCTSSLHLGRKAAAVCLCDSREERTETKQQYLCNLLAGFGSLPSQFRLLLAGYQARIFFCCSLLLLLCWGGGAAAAASALVSCLGILLLLLLMTAIFNGVCSNEHFNVFFVYIYSKYMFDVSYLYIRLSYRRRRRHLTSDFFALICPFSAFFSRHFSTLIRNS